MPQPTARERFFFLLRTAIAEDALTKLTLGKPRGSDPSLVNLFIRPVVLTTGPHLTFVFRHTTRDITKNHPPAEAIALIEKLLGTDFLDAHLFTTTHTTQVATAADGTARFSSKKNPSATAASVITPDTTPAASATAPTPAVASTPAKLPASPEPPAHDRPRAHFISADAPWLRSLGVTNHQGQPREGMAGKFRQINKFVELLSHLTTEANFLPAALPLDAALASQPTTATPSPSPLAPNPSPPLRVADMGSGKGYLTFATAAFFGSRADVHGIESRPELVELCNRLARDSHLENLRFSAGTIMDAPLDAIDILIALHACDTATDDALARGITAGAKLLVVSPCCQKELRPQLTAPDVLAGALRHGIFQERQAEFVTDALRAELLEWAGYKTKVFEFISTEHTAKNLMIAAIKVRSAAAEPDAQKLRALAAFYGIRTHRLAHHLGLSL